MEETSVPSPEAHDRFGPKRGDYTPGLYVTKRRPRQFGDWYHTDNALACQSHHDKCLLGFMNMCSSDP